jgi:hypothetical protein
MIRGETGFAGREYAAYTLTGKAGEQVRFLWAMGVLAVACVASIQ